MLTEGVEKGLVKKTEMTTKLTIDGITDMYPVYKVKWIYYISTIGMTE